jgi:hypothetical protein
MPDVSDRITQLLYPLAAFCGPEVVSRLEILDPAQLPEPYRRLLAHENDMTGTLERYHGQPMVLRVAEKIVTADAVMRQVELIGQHDETVAEFGAIRIHLDCFADEPKRLVIEGHRPLGGILTGFSIAFVSRPGAFFRIKPDHTIKTSLRAPLDGWLYGRCNQLFTPAGASIADAVEILPAALAS